MDVVDNEELLLREEGNSRSTRCHGKKLRKGRRLRHVKKYYYYSFPQRSTEARNNLSEDVVLAKSVQSLKEKLDKYGYGDGTTRT